MTPLDLFQDGQLNEAIAAQRALLASHPDEISERLCLCDLLGFGGQWPAIQTHLGYLANGPHEIREYLNEWSQLLQAESERRRKATPHFLIKPPPQVLLRVQAREKTAKHADLIDEADELTPEIEGYIDGRPFEGFRDTDDFLGPMLEVFHGGRFIWLAMEQLRRLRLSPVESLRDSLFRPASIRLTDGFDYEVFLPVLYEATNANSPMNCQLGLLTDWSEKEGMMQGIGAKQMQFGEEELTFADFDQIEIRE